LLHSAAVSPSSHSPMRRPTRSRPGRGPKRRHSAIAHSRSRTRRSPR
jgi:hypothetical protein